MTTAEILSITLLVLHLVIGFFAAVAISLRRKPATAIAWIMTIVFIPFIGLIAFLLVGFGRLPRRRREQQRQVNELMLQRSEVDKHRSGPGHPQWLDTAVVLNENLGALPMVAGNRAILLDHYEGSIDAMIADIEQAQDYIHVEFFILVRDATTRPFFDALARATARGVHVRVLSDHLSGFMYPERRSTQRALADMGGQWRPMLPLRPLRGQWQRPDLRNHRKIVVIDGQVGYTGSQNLIDSTYLKKKNVRRGLHWMELMVRFEGPIVGELDAVFVTDWASETDELLALQTHPAYPALNSTVGVSTLSAATNSTVATSATESKDAERTSPVGQGLGVPVEHVDAQIIPSGPSFENDNNLKLFVMLIHNARRRVSVTSPYFVPDESTMLALLTAASRGLDVELFVSEIGDQLLVHHAQRSYYAELLDAGVAIYLYQAPTVLHAKHFTIDEEVTVIGSSNMDIRSFSLNMEVSVLVRSREFVNRMRLVEDDYRSSSVRLDPQEWAQRPLPHKVLDGLSRLTSALM